MDVCRFGTARSLRALRLVNRRESLVFGKRRHLIERPARLDHRLKSLKPILVFLGAGLAVVLKRSGGSEV
jgi:hypothetical protein